MAWRKKRRHPISGFSVLCFSCGFLFLAGNLYMLQSGFVQLYESAAGYGEGRSGPREGEAWRGLGPDSGVENVLHGLPEMALADIGLWDPKKHRHKEQPRGQHLSIETKLRKLMENPHYRDGTTSGLRVGKLGGEHTPHVPNQNHPSHIDNSNNKKYRDSRLEEHNRNAQTVISVPLEHLKQALLGGSGCGELANLTGAEFLASGWTKAVFKASLRGRDVAVKKIDLNGHDMNHCLETYHLSQHDCYARSSQKILKEILLLGAMDHPHIVKVLGYCIPEVATPGGEIREIQMMTELGEPLDIIRLLQMSWEDRLRIAVGLTRLLAYLASCPYGSVSLNDFRRQQFVLVSGEVKLTDVDDVGFQEPHCNHHTDCQDFHSSANHTLRTPCINGRCQGFNEKKNIFNAARHFTTFLLPHGAPPSVRPLIDSIVTHYANATWRAEELLHNLNKVVEMYKSGQYLQRTPQQSLTGYECSSGWDLPGVFDYQCRWSIASVGCTISVFDQKEAEDTCDSDPECRAFVMSDKTTWTGRIITHLKNNVTTPSQNSRTTLCVKPAKS